MHEGRHVWVAHVARSADPFEPDFGSQGTVNKFVDHEEDPYDISKGFFHAHIGWILFKLQPDTSLDGVNDLRQDRLIAWQHRHYHLIAALTCFGLPTLLGC